MRIKNLYFVCICGISITSILGCSDARVSGGNSSEVGNPEISGIVMLPSGSYARNATIKCVNSSFNPSSDSLSQIDSTTTDSLGYFKLSLRHNESCNLEIKDTANWLKSYYTGLSFETDHNIQIITTLQSPGSIRIGVDSVANGDSILVYIPGTTLSRYVLVQFSSIIIDSIATGMYGSIHLVYNNQEIIQENVRVFSAKQTSISEKRIQYELSMSLATDSDHVNLKDTLFGFPLVVRLNSENIDFRYIKKQMPMRVYLGDSTRLLGYRISRWDEISQQAEIWVRIDTLLPDIASQNLKFQWDEYDTTQVENLKAPFSSEDRFVASWHFDEGADQFLDVGEYGFDGRTNDLQTYPGVVGNGLWFNGRSSYVSIPGSSVGPLNFNDSSTFTISVWANIHNTGTTRFVFGKGYYQYNFVYKYPNEWQFDYLAEQVTEVRQQTHFAADSVNENQKWVLFTLLHQNREIFIFRNGELVSSSLSMNNTTDVRMTDITFEIGRRLLPDGYSDRIFWGVLDEMSISNVPRSSEWIRLTFLNQKEQDYWPQ